MSIVNISGNEIQLNTGLSQEAFAKTNMVLALEEKGCTVRNLKSNEKSVEEFKFSEIKEENGNIYFTARSIQGKPLQQSLSKKIEERTEEDIEIIANAVSALGFAISSDIQLPCVGAEGILVGKDEALFLPEELFDRCAVNSDYAEIQGKYIYKGLEGKPALIYLRDTIAYKALTGKFPFEEENLTKRQSDILDGKNAPVEMHRDDIPEELSEAINNGLKMKAIMHFKAGRRNFSNEKELEKQEKTMASALKFDEKEFSKLLEEKELKENPELTEKREDYLKSLKKRIAIRRFFRRNKNRIIAGISAVLIFFWMANGFVKENGRLITTRGLDSVQTTALFYSMIHKADVPNLKETIKGKKLDDLILKVTGFYVSGKQREEFDASEATVKPAQLLFYKENTKNWMFGISNLIIDGTEYPSEIKFSRKQDKPLPIIEENGLILKKGETITHTASYYLIHQEPNRIGIEKITDNVTLTWTGKQWKVTEISGTSKPEPVKTSQFNEDFYSLQKNGMSIKEAVNQLKGKYNWLPSEADMRAAAEYLFTTYKSTEAEKYLQE